MTRYLKLSERVNVFGLEHVVVDMVVVCWGSGSSHSAAAPAETARSAPKEESLEAARVQAE